MLLISRLRKTKVNVNSVYKAVKLDLDKTEERYNRNLNLLTMLLEDYGLKEYIDFVEKTTGKTIFEDIFDFFDKHQVDVDELDSKSEQCDTLDGLYVEHIFKICEDNNFSIGISDTINIHLESKRLQAEKLDAAKREQKKNTLNAKRREIINQTDIELNDAVRNHNYSKYGETTVKLLIAKLKLLGNKGYYIIGVKQRQANFMFRDGKMVIGLKNLMLFADRELAEQYLNKYKQDGFYYSICVLSCSEQRGKKAFSVVDRMNTPSHLAYWLNETLNQRPSETVISDSLLYILKKDLRNGKEYVLINDNNEYYGDYPKQFSVKPTQIRLLSEDEKDEWLKVDNTLKAYKLTFDNVITDNLMDKIFEKYENGTFMNEKLFTRSFNEYKPKFYYVVVYDIENDRIWYVGNNNTLVDSVNTLYLYEYNPVISLDNTKYIVRVYEKNYTTRYNTTMELFDSTLREHNTKSKDLLRWTIFRYDKTNDSLSSIVSANARFLKYSDKNSLYTFATKQEAEEFCNKRLLSVWSSKPQYLYRIRQLS